MDDFKILVESYNYLVLGSDTSCNVYSSLRNISNEICVDYSTISKKLSNNSNYCIVSPKKSPNLYYYIKKINKID